MIIRHKDSTKTRNRQTQTPVGSSNPPLQRKRDGPKVARPFCVSSCRMQLKHCYSVIFIAFFTFSKYRCVRRTLYFIPPFHERIAFSTSFIGLCIACIKRNISFDFDTLSRSTNRYFPLFFQFFENLIALCNQNRRNLHDPNRLPTSGQSVSVAFYLDDGFHHWCPIKSSFLGLLFISFRQDLAWP